MEKDVIIFSTPTCHYCIMAKRHLDEKKIQYKEVDVSMDQKAADQMFEKSHNMGVPQLWIGDQVIVGFDPGSINEILGIK